MPAISADVEHTAYTVSGNPETGRTRDQLWILDIENNKSKRPAGENETGSGAVWSHDGKWIAFTGKS